MGVVKLHEKLTAVLAKAKDDSQQAGSQSNAEGGEAPENKVSSGEPGSGDSEESSGESLHAEDKESGGESEDNGLAKPELQKPEDDGMKSPEKSQKLPEQLQDDGRKSPQKSLECGQRPVEELAVDGVVKMSAEQGDPSGVPMDGGQKSTQSAEGEEINQAEQKSSQSAEGQDIENPETLQTLNIHTIM